LQKNLLKTHEILMKRKLNVLMISATVKVGGGPIQMLILSEQLINKVNTFFAIPKSNQFSKKINNKNSFYIKERSISLIELFKLKRFIEFHRIDIIHAHGKGAGLIGRLLKLLTNKPLIYTFHGFHIKCHNFLYKSLYIIYENLFGLLDNKKIFVSKSEKRYASKFLFFLGKNFSIINNSVNNMEFIYDIGNKRKIDCLLGSNKKIILSISRLVDQKNIPEIIRIASILNSYNFLIIGDGPNLDQISLMISENKIKNVYLIGLKKNIYDYLYGSDIFLTTSIYEGLPMSVLEAMSVGLPIIASNVIGNKDTIEHKKSGFLYELGDIKRASYFIEKILKDDELKEKFSRNSFKRQRKLFSHNRMVSAYLSIYECY